MSLDLTPGGLDQEIKAAEQYRNSFLAAWESRVRRFTGSGYRSDWCEPTVENHGYEYISLTVPRIIFDNPRVKCTTLRPGTQRMVAQALRFGLNRWSKQSRIRNTLLRVATDMSFAFGATLMCQKTMPGMDPRAASAPNWPAMHRLSPRQFFFDPLCMVFGEARYVGHCWTEDRAGLAARAAAEPGAGWNLDAIAALQEAGEDAEYHDRAALQFVPDRKQVLLYEVWVPEVQTGDPDKGFHGTIYTVAAGQGSGTSGALASTWIREPRPYYGHRSGPYTLYGCYVVPDVPFPLSPLAAVESQAIDLDTHAKAANRSAASYKRVVLYDAGNPDLGQKLADAPHDFVVPVQGLQKDQVIAFEVGGITEQDIKHLAMMRERLDRSSGIHDAMRGNVSGKPTATEVAVADSAGTVRLAFVKQQFADAVQQDLIKAAWWMYHDDRVVFPLGEDAALEMGMGEPWFHGGLHDEESGATFDDLELEIEPYSMERVNEALQQQQTMAMAEFITNTAPLAPTVPWVDWRELYQRVGDALNQDNMADILQTEMLGMGLGMGLGQPMLGRQFGQGLRAAQPGVWGGYGGPTQQAAPRGGGLGGLSPMAGQTLGQQMGQMLGGAA